MFFIGKAVNYLFVPPGLFLVLIAAGILFSVLGKRKAGLILSGAALYLMYILSTEVVKDKLLLPLENAYPAFPAADADSAGAPGSIVVLGGGIIPSSPEEEGKGVPAGDAYRRLVYGYLLQKQLRIPIAVSGGIVYDREGEEPEADASARYLGKLGTESGFIRVESSSRNTMENAVFIKNLGLPEPVLLVTSAYHMPRAVYCFKKQGMEIIPAPTDYKTQRIPYTALSFIPDMGELYGSVRALKEYLGIVFYKIRY